MNSFNLSHLLSPPKPILMLLPVAALFSSFTLWLGNSWTKYPFFIIEMFAIVTIYIVLNNYDLPFGIRKNYNGIQRIFNGYFTDIILVCLSLALIFLNTPYIAKG